MTSKPRRLALPPLMSAAARLDETRPHVDLSTYARLWRQADIRIEAVSSEGFSVDDTLAGRIRGALGRRLLGSDQWDTAAAFELFFEEAPAWRTGNPDLPRPYVLAAAGRSQSISVKLSLFGFAGALAQAVAASLCDALEGGIAVAERARSRAPLQVKSCELSRSEGVVLRTDVAEWVCAVFQSPVSIMQGNRTNVNAENLVAALSRRIALLAPWQDVQVSTGELCEATCKFDWKIVPRSHTRSAWNSGRQHKGGLVMEGTRLCLVGRGRSAGIETVMRLGERAHVGARTAFGFGAYRCFVV